MRGICAGGKRACGRSSAGRACGRTARGLGRVASGSKRGSIKRRYGSGLYGGRFNVLEAATAPPASMEIIECTTRESCVVRPGAGANPTHRCRAGDYE